MESVGSVSGEITMHIGLFPQAQEKAKTYPEGEYLHDIQTNYDHQYFYHRVKYFHSFKINESLHSLIIALCIISGEVVFANCGSLCCGKIRNLQTSFSYDAKGVQSHSS